MLLCAQALHSEEDDARAKALGVLRALEQRRDGLLLVEPRDLERALAVHRAARVGAVRKERARGVEVPAARGEAVQSLPAGITMSTACEIEFGRPGPPLSATVS